MTEPNRITIHMEPNYDYEVAFDIAARLMELLSV
jgi:hypothetical protein